LITALTLISCSGPVAGGGSDTEVSSRKVAGVVLDSAGTPVADAVVKIRPSQYITDSLYSLAFMASHYIRDGKTGTDGSFCFDSILADDYCLDISKEDSLGAVNQFSISDSVRELRLSSINLEPFAVIDGNIRVFGTDSADCFLQVVGTDYRKKADTSGYFSMRIPRGWHTVHFGAYEPIDTLKTKSIDHIDFSFTINENYKYMGDFWLKPTPPEQCTDFTCDSIIMRKALDDMHLYNIDVRAVTTIENNRIVGLNLRRIPIFYVSKYVESLTELRTLDAGATGIFDIFPTIGMLQKLETLKVDSNKIGYLPFGLVYLRSLKTFDIKSNFISGMPPGFQNMKLENLDLSNNKICSPDSVFVNWANIYDPDWRSTQFCQ
jgi:hypothetical protein